MGKILLFFLVVGAVIMALGAVLKFAAIAALAFIGMIVAAVLIAFFLLICRSIYHAISPAAKQRYLEANERKERQARDTEEKLARAEAEKARVLEEAEQQRLVEISNTERAARTHRDADEQSEPYRYGIGTHANEALAIRYGIANQDQASPYDSARDHYNGKRNRGWNPKGPARTIRLQKIRLIRSDVYEVHLTDYNNRLARAVIEKGTEYVKTFLPLDDVWFSTHADLELALKGNGSFSLKELAKFHIDKTIKPASP